MHIVFIYTSYSCILCYGSTCHWRDKLCIYTLDNFSTFKSYCIEMYCFPHTVSWMQFSMFDVHLALTFAKVSGSQLLYHHFSQDFDQYVKLGFATSE